MEFLNEGKVWKVDRRIALGLVLAANLVEKKTLTEKLGGELGATPSDAESIINKLTESNFLVNDSGLKKHAHPSLAPDIWIEAGAREAGEYHCATFDFQFMDYSPTGSGRKIPQDRMFKFAAEAPDIDRFKNNYEYLMQIPIPSPNKAIISNETKEFVEKITNTISLAVMPTGERTIPWSDAPLYDALLKSALKNLIVSSN